MVRFGLLRSAVLLALFALAGCQTTTQPAYVAGDQRLISTPIAGSTNDWMVEYANDTAVSRERIRFRNGVLAVRQIFTLMGYQWNRPSPENSIRDILTIQYYVDNKFEYDSNLLSDYRNGRLYLASSNNESCAIYVRFSDFRHGDYLRVGLCVTGAPIDLVRRRVHAVIDRIDGVDTPLEPPRA